MTEDEYAEIAALIDDGRNTKQIMCRLGCSEALVLEVRAERTRRGACERTARYKAEGPPVEEAQPPAEVETVETEPTVTPQEFEPVETESAADEESAPEETSGDDTTEEARND